MYGFGKIVNGNRFLIWLSKNTGNAVGNDELSFSLLENSMQEYQIIYKENKRTIYAFSYQPNLTTISEMSEFCKQHRKTEFRSGSYPDSPMPDKSIKPQLYIQLLVYKATFSITFWIQILSGRLF